MNKSLKAVIAAILLVVLIAMLLGGCGNFREQALEAQSNVDEAVRRAEIAEDAAARNAGLIRDLQHRIDALEATLVELQELQPND
ncbi:hypothetical protein KAH43_04615 [Candidatus Bipolaricaulota bacterium]|nr:hypothetical protein [Candidatus Bipolaricaulota bacterium]